MTPAEEHRVASFFARPGHQEVLRLVDGWSAEQILSLVQKVRVEQWRDLSNSPSQAFSAALRDVGCC